MYRLNALQAEEHILDFSALVLLQALLAKLSGNLIDEFRSVLLGVVHAELCLVLIVLVDGLHDLLTLAVSANNQQITVIGAHIAEHQKNKENDTRTDSGNFKVLNTAANTRSDAPENISRISGIFDCGTETNDRERTDHTERQRNVISDYTHDQRRHNGQHDQRHIELGAIDSSRMRKLIADKDDHRNDDGCDKAHQNLAGGQRPRLRG